MSVTQNILFTLLILGCIMIFATYTPSDNTYFWIYWASVTVLIAFGYLIDVLFGANLTFVFDPNPDNWRRKVDPLT